jgi:hypothetical protein
MTTDGTLRKRRDDKAIPHLAQYAPVWLIDEKILPGEEAIQFDVVFQHNLYGWVKRRYRFDGFNNVLYYKGQTILTEADVLKVQEKEPYIAVAVPDITNAYGG